MTSHLSHPHGGKLVNRVLTDKACEEAWQEAFAMPALWIADEGVREVENLATGVYSPLEGFMTQRDLVPVLHHNRLASGVPWTIPILLQATPEQADRLAKYSKVALWHEGEPLAILHLEEIYGFKPGEIAAKVFGTGDPQHPGVTRTLGMTGIFLAGAVDLLREVGTPFASRSLTPRETRVLFEAKGWRTVVGFQTRNVPHLGHEYVQKTALTFVDGIFINPVIGPKKQGDFKDEVIIRAYEALLRNYYLKDRTVMAILQTEMRYAGPREAIFHAIIRKNYGCTHFIVGRDHAGVGQFYSPYAAQEIFAAFPDLGITPLFFTAFFYCKRCGAVANDKICPHPPADHVAFSGTLVRDALKGTGALPAQLLRPEVIAALKSYENPFVD
jgi:sulfate adenylyltransferase